MTAASVGALSGAAGGHVTTYVGIGSFRFEGMLLRSRHYLLDLGRDLSTWTVEDARRLRVSAAGNWVMVLFNLWYGAENLSKGVVVMSRVNPPGHDANR
ncbi:MAG: hypothetical protein AB8H79_11235 [Myxococcota bacterium]